MRPSLFFCVPAHGRHEMAAICLRQLRRTCDALIAEGVDASAVVVADDENLLTARSLGFATIRRDNRFVSKKFNDALQLACDPAVNPRPVDYAVPMGSDDFVDYRLFLDLPGPDTVVGFQRMSFVREDGRQMVTTILNYPGGAGIRIYPRALLEPLGYRPADEDRGRACDTSILNNVQLHHRHGMRITHAHLHDRQIVDWKSPGEQLNSFDQVVALRRSGDGCDPFVELAGVYPAEALSEMRAHYFGAEQVAA